MPPQPLLYVAFDMPVPVELNWYIVLLDALRAIRSARWSPFMLVS